MRSAAGIVSYKAVVIAAVVTIEIAEPEFLALNDHVAHRRAQDNSYELIGAIERAADQAVAERLPEGGIIRIERAHLVQPS